MRCEMSFSPLWPAMPPPCFTRATPGGKSSSSCTTRISSGLILKKPASIGTGGPLAFMNVCGRRSQAPGVPAPPGPASIRATSAWYFGSLRKCAPLAEAKRSTSQKPALCRVRSYSLPGLPRPTTRRIKAGYSEAGYSRQTIQSGCVRSFLLFLLAALVARLVGGRLLAAFGSGALRARLVGALGSLAFFRRGLLGGRHLGRRDHCRGGGFLFLGDERRDDDGPDHRGLVLVEDRLGALRQAPIGHVGRVARGRGAHG